jgi:hypothetical protein
MSRDVPSPDITFCGDDDARFCNQSDTPNMGACAPLFDPAHTHDALRDIEAGEESTCDYRIGDVAPFYGLNARAAVKAVVKLWNT